jgi:hypothetical protein
MVYTPPRQNQQGQVTRPEQVQELVTNLNFASGVELSKNEEELFVVEGARSRIFK